jgi:hypothetical protein
VRRSPFPCQEVGRQFPREGSAVHALVRGSSEEREYSGKGASIPPPLFAGFVLGSAAAATVLLRPHFLFAGFDTEAPGDSLRNAK